MSVNERVVEIVSGHLTLPREKVNLEADFINDLGCDSLDRAELLMMLEEEFEIQIPDDKAEQFQTVGQAVDFIETQKT